MGNEENMYTPPESQVSDIEKPVEVVLASEYARLAALLIDGFVMTVVATLVVLVLTPTGVLDSFGQTLEGEGLVSVISQIIFGLLVYVGTNGRMLATRGQSVGKRLMKVRIVDMNNNIPPLRKILLFRILPIQVLATVGFFGSLILIVDSFFIFRPDRRCLHDRLAGTQVIKV